MMASDDGTNDRPTCQTDTICLAQNYFVCGFAIVLGIGAAIQLYFERYQTKIPMLPFILHRLNIIALPLWLVSWLVNTRGRGVVAVALSSFIIDLTSAAMISIVFFIAFLLLRALYGNNKLEFPTFSRPGIGVSLLALLVTSIGANTVAGLTNTLWPRCIFFITLVTTSTIALTGLIIRWKQFTTLLSQSHDSESYINPKTLSRFRIFLYQAAVIILTTNASLIWAVYDLVGHNLSLMDMTREERWYKFELCWSILHASAFSIGLWLGHIPENAKENTSIQSTAPESYLATGLLPNDFLDTAARPTYPDPVSISRGGYTGAEEAVE